MFLLQWKKSIIQSKNLRSSPISNSAENLLNDPNLAQFAEIHTSKYIVFCFTAYTPSLWYSGHKNMNIWRYMKVYKKYNAKAYEHNSKRMTYFDCIAYFSISSLHTFNLFISSCRSTQIYIYLFHSENKNRQPGNAKWKVSLAIYACLLHHLKQQMLPKMAWNVQENDLHK